MLVVGLGQLLASEIHSDFNLRNKIIRKFVVLFISIFPTHEEFAMSYTSLDLAQNLLSGRL